MTRKIYSEGNPNTISKCNPRKEFLHQKVFRVQQNCKHWLNMKFICTWSLISKMELNANKSIIRWNITISITLASIHIHFISYQMNVLSKLTTNQRLTLYNQRRMTTRGHAMRVKYFIVRVNIKFLRWKYFTHYAVLAIPIWYLF